MTSEPDDSATTKTRRHDGAKPSRSDRIYRLQAGDSDVLRRGRWTLENTAARKQNVTVARLIHTDPSNTPWAAHRLS